MYDHAWTCHDLAQLLVEEQRDMPRALALIDEGMQVAEEFGIKPLSDLTDQAPIPRASHCRSSAIRSNST